MSELSFLWQHCNVSQEPLRKPIVACGLGRLYNKDVIIEKLLDKSSIPESMSHIKALKVCILLMKFWYLNSLLLIFVFGTLFLFIL